MALLTALLSGCSLSPPSPSPSPSWHEAPIDHPDGTRLAVRDVTSCDGAWMVTGTLVDASGDTRPLVLHGEHFTPVTTSGGDLYAHHAIITTSACRGGTLVLLGTKSGGAHGMPRTSTFVGDTSAVHDVRAPFELFAGPDQLSVRHFAVGPGGFRLVGSRSTGAATWSSPDGRRFTLHDHEPGLASGPGEQTAGLDQVWYAGRWLVTGTVDGHATVFRQVDGRWVRVSLPATGAYSAAERVAETAEGLVAVGLDGREFRAWTSTDGVAWHDAGHVGTVASGSNGAPFVSGLASVSGGAVVSVSDGATYRLFRVTRVGGRWQPVSPPVRLPVSTGDHAVTLGAIGDEVLLSVDDGSGSRVWRARFSPGGP